MDRRDGPERHRPGAAALGPLAGPAPLRRLRAAAAVADAYHLAARGAHGLPGLRRSGVECGPHAGVAGGAGLRRAGLVLRRLLVGAADLLRLRIAAAAGDGDRPAPSLGVHGRLLSGDPGGDDPHAAGPWSLVERRTRRTDRGGAVPDPLRDRSSGLSRPRGDGGWGHHDRDDDRGDGRRRARAAHPVHRRGAGRRGGRRAAGAAAGQRERLHSLWSRTVPGRANWAAPRLSVRRLSGAVLALLWLTGACAGPAPSPAVIASWARSERPPPSGLWQFDPDDEPAGTADDGWVTGRFGDSPSPPRAFCRTATGAAA